MATKHTTLMLNIFAAGLLLIFALIPFHAPLSVWFGSLLPDHQLFIKSWKEIVMVLLVPLAVILSLRAGLLGQLRRQNILLLIGLYGLLHLVLIALFQPAIIATLAALAINLRFLLFFVLVFIAVLLLPSLRQKILHISFWAASVVVLFSLLQIFVLPPDILSNIGYGKETIAPFLTIDNNPDYIRINGTLRGPNPLGVYALIIISIVGAYALSKELRHQTKSTRLVLAGSLLAATPAVLWASYSRSALVAALISAVIVVSVFLTRHIKPLLLAGIFAVPALLGTLTILALQDTPFVQHVILHKDPEDPVDFDSDDEHLSSLQSGSRAVLQEPFGAGPGSTGSASLFTDKPLIIENQYLFIAHETGLLGLLLFIAIFALVLWRLWRLRHDWLCLGLFASGIGISLVGLLLPVWVDDTVSMVWWGLAAVAIASHSPLQKARAIIKATNETKPKKIAQNRAH